jgi:hypothetical protein
VELDASRLVGLMAIDDDGVILSRSRELSRRRAIGREAGDFCGGKPPIDKKLFLVPTVRGLSRRWNEARRTPLRYRMRPLARLRQ